MASVKKIRSYQEKLATGSDIRAITGPLDDDIVAAIMAIGATRAEVRQAFGWLEESRYTLSTMAKPMNERVRRVYEILDYASNGFGPENPWH